MLLVTENNFTLSSDLIELLNQTPQNINVAQYEGVDTQGIHIFRIVFLNDFSLQTPEAIYYLGKIAHEVNPHFLENGVYEKLVEVYESGNAQTITYEINFFGKQITIEALIVKMGTCLISYSKDITARLAKENILIAKTKMLDEAHKILEMGTWELDMQTKIISSSFHLGEFFELPNSPTTITLDEYYKLLFTENIEAIKQNFIAQISKDESFFMERRIVTQSGKDKYIEITGKPIFEKQICTKVIGTFREITKRKHHELELIKDEILLGEAKQLLLMCTWNFNPETKEAHYSKELSEILEFEEPTVLNSFDEYLQYIHPDDKQNAKENLSNSIASSNYNFKADRKILTQKGNIKYIEIVGQSIVRNGNVKRVFGTIRDITEEKIKLLGLFEQELRLQEIQQVLKIGTWSADIPNNTAFFSSELSEILEYNTPVVFHSYEEYFNHISPEERHLSKFNYDRIYNFSEVNYRIERKMISKKGNVKYIELTCQSYQEDEKIVRLFGTIKDITERKLKDIRLLESEQLLIEARNLLKMGSVRFDYTNDVHYLSEELSKILELDDLRAFYKFDDWWHYVAPEEKEISKRNFESGKIGAVTEVEILERKFISAKGNEKYVEFIFEPNQHNPAILTGTFRDITEKKIEEIKLLQAQKELIEARSLLKMGTWYFDLVNHTVHYSKELSQILQYDVATEFYDFEQFFAHVHADDKEKVQNSYYNKIDSTAETFAVTTDRKMVNYHGQICYIEFNTKAVYENGQKISIHGTFRDITEKKIKDLKIEESEQRLLEAQKMLKTGTWQFNTETRILQLSSEIRRLLNNNLPLVLSDKEYFEYINPSIRKKFIEKFNLLIKEKRNFKTINNYLFADGSEFFVEIVGHPATNKKDEKEFVGTFRDITEEHKKDIALKESEERFRLLFEHNPAMYFTLNEKGIILSVNQFGIDFLGYAKEELIALHVSKVFHPDDVHKAARNLEILKQSHENFWQWEIRKVKKNGEIIWVKETASIAKNKTGNDIFLIICEDITTEVENRELIKIKQKELIQAKEKAEEAAKEKQQFASIMSHEIRTPLNAVIGITNLLLMENPKPEQVQELNTLKFAGENLLLLVNDILDFGKIEAGKVVLESTPFNISSLIKNIKNSYIYKATEKGILLKSTIDEALPKIVLGDPTRLSQILTNLISNAIKFTEHGFVEITLRKMKSINGNEVKVRFEIADSGIGISKDKHHLIFESFSQANTDTNRKFGGTGLGLTITKKLIELHQSQIQLQSESGKGTTFYFDITFEMADDFIKNNEISNTLVETKDMIGKHILVVEDNAFNQLVAVKFLEKWQAIVDVADNGLIALKKIEQKKYDLILMDIQMPEMNGIEATHIIRTNKNEQIKNIPIIAFTAAADTDKEKMIAEGMNDSISKPFNPTELFNKILQFI
ncbi:MAG: hypothetical protein RJA07_813 [Bacteroidota bacterium]|jgi:PAS domain S-box-containing protein